MGRNSGLWADYRSVALQKYVHSTWDTGDLLYHDMRESKGRARGQGLCCGSSIQKEDGYNEQRTMPEYSSTQYPSTPSRQLSAPRQHVLQPRPTSSPQTTLGTSSAPQSLLPSSSSFSTLLPRLLMMLRHSKHAPASGPWHWHSLPRFSS